jgi:hypothetical protein
VPYAVLLMCVCACERCVRSVFASAEFASRRPRPERVGRPSTPDRGGGCTQTCDFMDK